MLKNSSAIYFGYRPPTHQDGHEATAHLNLSPTTTNLIAKSVNSHPSCCILTNYWYIRARESNSNRDQVKDQMFKLVAHTKCLAAFH